MRYIQTGQLIFIAVQLSQCRIVGHIQRSQTILKAMPFVENRVVETIGKAVADMAVQDSENAGDI